TDERSKSAEQRVVGTCLLRIVARRIKQSRRGRQNALCRRRHSACDRADQSAMSREEGGFLGETLADEGGASEAGLTDDEEPAPSGFAAARGGAASVGRRRGSGGDFRSTCGIGIGGTNRSSLCATGVARGAKKPDAGSRTGGAARASPDTAIDTSR